MKIRKENYLVLIYKNLPDIHFLCDSKGNIRVKISRLGDRLEEPLSPLGICAKADDSTLLFEDINGNVRSWGDLRPAIEWYRRFSKINRFQMINPEPESQGSLYF